MTTSDPRALITELRRLRRDMNFTAAAGYERVWTQSLALFDQHADEILTAAEAGLAAQERIAELEARLRGIVAACEERDSHANICMTAMQGLPDNA